MRKFVAFILLVVALHLTDHRYQALAQTVAFNDSSVIVAAPKKSGLNFGSFNYYDNGNMYKNVLGYNNPNMEPLIDQQIWVLSVAGTTTSFTEPDIYDNVEANYWAGATFTVVAAQSKGPELGCTGKIASNAPGAWPKAPVFTTSTACRAAFAIGDQIVINKTTSPTPESWWEKSGRGGFAGDVVGGAQLLSNTTDLCATCGSQTLNMNASAIGSSASATWYIDTSPENIFDLINGTYQLSFWAKRNTGKPTLSVTSLRRQSSGGFNCGIYTPMLTSTWARYTFSCKAMETQTRTAVGAIKIALTATGGSVYLDNVSFEKTDTSSSNTTVLKDEVIARLQQYYGMSSGSPAGLLRDWTSQNGETIDNWTQPDYKRRPSTAGLGYYIGPGGGGGLALSLEDYLAICQLLGVQPYLELPVTMLNADAANLVEFLSAPASATNSVYGQRRIALGQKAPWTSVFSQIHLSFCNECWNGGTFPGETLPDRTNQPNGEYYFDYSTRTRAVFAAMRADGYYSAPKFDLVMNLQTAVSYTADEAIKRAQPDSVELEDYSYGNVNNTSSDAQIWQPAFIDPYQKMVNAKDPSNFYQSVHDYQAKNYCGPSGTSTCRVNIYEWGQGSMGNASQQYMDYINAGAGEGVVMALQPLLNIQRYGIVNQNYFALAEYQNRGNNKLTVKLWGSVVDMGGATNNVRPTFLGVQLANQSIIGPMYSCPINGNLLYNYPGNEQNGHSKGTQALNNVPYLYAFCFKNGSTRSIVLINTDLKSGHALKFSGTNPPTGTVAETIYAPATLNQMNEAPSGMATNHTAATTSLTKATVMNPGSITLTPSSVFSLTWNIGDTAAQRKR